MILEAEIRKGNKITFLLFARWASQKMRRGHLNVRPTIKSGAILITHGPYRYIALYASLLLAGTGTAPYLLQLATPCRLPCLVACPLLQAEDRRKAAG